MGIKLLGPNLLKSEMDFSVEGENIRFGLTSIKGIAEKCFLENGIEYDKIIYDMPNGERILVNDIKPSGLKTAYSYNLTRDTGL